MDYLAVRVQSLPQELYDQVYDLVFTAPVGQVVDINASYVPPAALQVNLSSRKQFANSYYGNTVFTLEDDFTVEMSSDAFESTDIDTDALHQVTKWLGSISSAQQRLVRDIRVVVHLRHGEELLAFAPFDIEAFSEDMSAALDHELIASNLETDRNVVTLEVHVCMTSSWCRR